LQALFSAMLLLIISLITIPLVIIQSEAQPLLSRQEKLLFNNNNNIAFFFLDPFEYTFDIAGTQIFPNDTIKHSIVTEYNPSVYNISSLQYHIMDHIINASNVQIHVNPTRIDEANTKLDFQIYANNAEVTGQWLSKTFNDLEIRSAYAIYNLVTDKMTIHIPYDVALQHLLQ
jgi:diketogulonate reductase-like aldo/keto reductase